MSETHKFVVGSQDGWPEFCGAPGCDKHANDPIHCVAAPAPVTKICQDCGCSEINQPKTCLTDDRLSHRFVIPAPVTEPQETRCVYCNSAKGEADGGCRQNLDENGYGPHNFQQPSPPAPEEPKATDTPWQDALIRNIEKAAEIRHAAMNMLPWSLEQESTVHAFIHEQMWKHRAKIAAALRAEATIMRQLGFTFYCHRKSIVQALRNELHRQSHSGGEVAAPDAERRANEPTCPKCGVSLLNYYHAADGCGFAPAAPNKET